MSWMPTTDVETVILLKEEARAEAVVRSYMVPSEGGSRALSKYLTAVRAVGRAEAELNRSEEAPA